MTDASPLPVLGLRARRRADGTPFLVAVLDEDLHLPAGAELHLVRVRDELAGDDAPTHGLRIFPPAVAPSAAALRRAAADRLDGSAIRHDHRDFVGCCPPGLDGEPGLFPARGASTP